MSSNQQLDVGTVAKAMALRVKYRVAEPRRNIAIELVGPHIYNRAGAYPSGNHAYLLAYGVTPQGGWAAGVPLGCFANGNVDIGDTRCQNSCVFTHTFWTFPSFPGCTQDFWVYPGSVYPGGARYTQGDLCFGTAPYV